MSKNYRILDLIRRNRSPLENHLIDGLVDGRVSRRDFIRHGSLLGLSLPLLGGITTAAGLGAMPSLVRAQGAPGATIRVASSVPAATIDPVTIADAGGLLIMQQVAEFLCVDGPDLVLKPALAESWKPNDNGSVWTFKLRKGVKFHSGGEMKADDVVASIDRIADPANSSNALSVFTGILSKGASKKVDDYTVEFHLDAPNGNFPYMVSSDNYNAVIVPASYKGDYEKSFDGTGPFKIDKYTPKVGASFVRNEGYWGEKALPERTEFTFFADMQPMILALQGGQVDIINQMPVLSGVALLNDPNIDIISLKSSAHQQLHLRCDDGPMKDARVRRAIALSLDRDKLVAGLMKGRAVAGNDSPFAPVYPSTDASVPQRKQDIAQAKQLMEAAGAGKGFKMTLTTERYLEIPEYAQLIQNWVKEIGIELELNILDQSAYYGDAVFGKSNWLDSEMGITDYGHRGVPNVYLAAPLKSEGTWNAAHFKNKDYDALATSYIAALDLEAQKATAGKIQKLLLEETPVIFGYFYDYLTATAKGVAGVQPTAMSQLFLEKASKA
ncbi:MULTISPECIES: ABC transporter substrate-binding protein [unclassified Mesorhizobium]|uniref:ABC transporter substrate-binding protein n=1 Tax=unclassified Mesorhizobium TaxID=325217 RepID=UPI00112EC84D|nr:MULTISPECIES: ABC transporter substrate-binding protein [unclassified Mesorhizobium]MBZ9704566.1 ABC transporter substrate-binding protein [Mesorhizobium sp. CO1-1-3]MBZ9916466.1 ABC transporter substrate-binding protein [Mesorhizobium sp. BR1-1-7]MBZ9948946.1 ABC transporter substrate-binding protein [Mesorhizobium sp. BR1-1-11]MBZ9951502.1 ABC transporter substrate-binding protein [Mesorhizobium sp. BR1-1-15]MBZ9957314.1 ABC transporter substrate-binding protein [Mesorhizobium sp. BR1-1-1